ncbi:4Fe-4S dicluster domain-containing protein [Atlantibacter subterranea]|uniref:4Fe-4S dicluster domain-containing protein n=1 Tax=Atlantibacter subterraneus TaxID=255519 RepID=A0A427UP50_9ENTR|nr:FAD-dependent oxidoreductase [Atlantibacter subterranea]MDA3133644.1 FAD-dependent oxidoreductase [Atlantibacter subterranea]RSB59510.1 4Fe-4S dicluster domain-containing protein [Atlantibacter subterranea]RSE01599.1 4Fe-4S dicluster domain-containing protein [Atlantibacter subterranea]RSE22371.1 4Fe-4S dicluster domain-containing protein [Atlantibacter subterranea]
MNRLIVADSRECIGCRACEVACVVAHNDGWPQQRSDFLPRIRVIFNGEHSSAVTCKHCLDAPCVKSCPVEALHYDNDAIQLDSTRCIGCKSCLVACPFGAIDIVVMADEKGLLAQKCDLCQSLESAQPACVSHCPTQALRIMDGNGLGKLRRARQLQAANPQGFMPEPQNKIILRKPPRKGAEKRAAAERKTHFDEIYHGLDEAQASYESERCLYCAQKAWCNWTCPVHNAIPDLIRLVQQGRIKEAAQLSHQTSSLPEICGRVCPQDRLCEGACTLKNRSGAVTVGNIERYITDSALKMGWRPSFVAALPRRERVAVIGAGPAGLGCADFLAREGVKVDVFDRHPEIGGLLTFGIPPFKLDKSLLSQRREIFSEMGIQFHLNCEIGRDKSFHQLTEEYDAVFLAMGTYGLMTAGLEHEDAPGVIQALPFLIANTRRVMGLEDSSDYPWTELKGKQVVVLGGGDTAMDCLRTSVRREAASVTCAYRRDEASMPGSRKEVTNAREEGVEFLFNVQPQYIARDARGQVSGIGLIRTEMGAAGPDGRRRPQPIAGSEFELPADVLIMAFGFRPHAMPWLQGSGVRRDDDGLIITGGTRRLATQTTRDNVFAGGDAVHGADLVVTAMAAGHQAARDILAMFERNAASQLAV